MMDFAISSSSSKQVLCEVDRVENMTLHDLRQELRRRNAKTSGRKHELVERKLKRQQEIKMEVINGMSRDFCE